ncbi:DUF3376 domain-containing protein [Nonomuraea sp. NPDC052129]|uniref:DUF3376 domain-containing protein n=1 Tax=Nonomuraea sp. NPDC052129 TaxID=3154651 RepID=UPI0034274207
MAGVTHELDLLCRASRSNSATPASETEGIVYGKWKALANRKNASVLVDVVAGTSAGGLNGTLLATAIGQEAKLPDLLELWEKSADLENLTARSVDPRNSLLDGKYFEEEIKKALMKIDPVKHPREEPREESVTLFMTATALDGRSRSFKDGFEGHFDVRDHRRIYRFQYDKNAVTYKETDSGWNWASDDNPRNDFAPENIEALMQAARATASFPVAFGPVDEAPMIDYRYYPKSALHHPASNVMDGGVLNNAPFGPVLEAISKRKLDRPIKRVVVYVVPSVGRVGKENITHKKSTDISWIDALLNARRYPQEADFRSSAEELEACLSNSIRDIHLDLFDRLSKEKERGEKYLDAAKNLLDEYRHNRAVAVLQEVLKKIADADTEIPLIAPPEPKSDEIKNILKEPQKWLPRDGDEIHVPDLDQWRWGLSSAIRALQTLSTHLHMCLKDEDVEKDPGKQKILIDGAAIISDQYRKALAVQEAVFSQLRNIPRPASLTWKDLNKHLDTVLEALKVPAELGSLIEIAAQQYRDTANQINSRKAWSGPKEVVSLCLAVDVLTRAFAPHSEIIESLTPKFDFLRLGPDHMSPLFWQDRFADLGDRKLHGIRLMHFGAFIDPEWRRSDFIWGRLDAAHHILSLLFPGDGRRQQWEKELHEAILAEEDGRGTGSVGNAETLRSQMLEDLEQLKDETDKTLLASAKIDNGKVFGRLIAVAYSILRDSSAQSSNDDQGGTASRYFRKIVTSVVALAERDDANLPDAAKTRPYRVLRWITASARKKGYKAAEEGLKRVPKEVGKEALYKIMRIVTTIFATGASIGVIGGVSLARLLRRSDKRPRNRRQSRQTRSNA